MFKTQRANCKLVMSFTHSFIHYVFKVLKQLDSQAEEEEEEEKEEEEEDYKL